MNTTFKKNHSYEMVLHRPVEPARILSKFTWPEGSSHGKLPLVDSVYLPMNSTKTFREENRTRELEPKRLDAANNSRNSAHERTHTISTYECSRQAGISES
jgi:hypothetical protein